MASASSPAWRSTTRALLLAGALPAAMLALAFEGGFALLERRLRRGR
jgi:ABC-type proline/glycine betaine transport system permease subunit